MSKKKDAALKTEEKKAREPKDPNLRCKAYKFRLYPTKKQVGKLEWMMRRCKELYNAALQERRDAYKMCGVSVSYRMQADQLPAIKKLREEYRDLHSQVLQEVLKRLDKAFQAFFRRVMNGKSPAIRALKVATAIIVSPTHREALRSCMGNGFISPKSDTSRSNFIERCKPRSRPAPSRRRESNGMQC